MGASTNDTWFRSVLLKYQSAWFALRTHRHAADVIYSSPFISLQKLTERFGCRIKSRFPQTRAVVMTGNRRVTVAELMDDSRIDGWLFKPFSLGERRDLLSRIGMPMEGRGAF
jgi:hypothetical protein